MPHNNFRITMLLLYFYFFCEIMFIWALVALFGFVVLVLAASFLARNYLRHLSYVHDKNNIPFPEEFNFLYGEAAVALKAYQEHKEIEYRLRCRTYCATFSSVP